MSKTLGQRAWSTAMMMDRALMGLFEVGASGLAAETDCPSPRLFFLLPELARETFFGYSIQKMSQIPHEKAAGLQSLTFMKSEYYASKA